MSFFLKLKTDIGGRNIVKQNINNYKMLPSKKCLKIYFFIFSKTMYTFSFMRNKYYLFVYLQIVGFVSQKNNHPVYVILLPGLSYL